MSRHYRERTATVDNPAVLLLASKFDFACDYVVSKLRKAGVSYVRLNTEDLDSFAICLDPSRGTLDGTSGALKFRISADSLRSVYFRRAVYLREYGVPKEIDEQFSRIQWSAFIRNLMLFNKCLWMNDPAATYRAEHKALQLAVASRLGFDIPRTIVANSADFLDEALGPYATVAVKGIDTVLMRTSIEECFGYTQLIEREELLASDYMSAPMIAQEAILDKTDIRVTVVGESAFAASVTKLDGGNIVGDWRLRKSEAVFELAELPSEILEKCTSLVKELGLVFGAIDLGKRADTYYFFEINPTGEWAWLVDRAGLPIDSAIAEVLGG